MSITSSPSPWIMTLIMYRVEPRGRREADGGRQGEFLTSDCYVDECGARVCERLGDRRLDLLRCIHSPAPDPGGVGNVGEILATEGRAVVFDACGLHLLLHEAECPVVEDDNLDIELKLTEGQHVAH